MAGKNIVIDIEQDIKQSSRENTDSSEFEKKFRFVPRVEKSFRRGNENYYTPKIVSIGPYHSEKSHLQAMGKFKDKFLEDLLSRSKLPKTSEDCKMEVTFEDCKQEVSKNEKETRARKCYQGINMNPEEDDGFLAMMVRDAGFIIELFMKINDGEKVRQFHSVLHLIKRDLLLLENQLPFFVLKSLFKFIFGKGFSPALDKLAINFFNLPVKKTHNPTLPLASVQHLLHLYRSQCCLDGCPAPGGPAISMIPCATTLGMMGVTFKKDASRESSLIDVKFHTDTNVLAVPQLSVSENSVSLLFNLVVLEQSNDRFGTHFTSYAVFMNNMLSKAEDVDLLCKKKIIMHGLANHEEVVNIFAKMCAGAFINPRSSALSGVLGAIKEYSESDEAIRKKTIMEGKPWYFIFYQDKVTIALTLFGALGIWVFTLAQTVFAVLSYFHKS